MPRQNFDDGVHPAFHRAPNVGGPVLPAHGSLKPGRGQVILQHSVRGLNGKGRADVAETVQTQRGYVSLRHDRPAG
ncbi:MAG: hypothetical protein ABTA24_10655 [Arthrobacter sp.]